MPNLTDFTDDELVRALHFIDGHMDSLDPQELRAFRLVRSMLITQAVSQRDVDADDA